MSVIILLLFVCGIIIISMLVLLFYLHSHKIHKYLNKCIKKFVFKKTINKQLLAHNQEWKCASCKTIILSNFRIASIESFDYAICCACSPRYRCIDNV